MGTFIRRINSIGNLGTIYKITRRNTERLDQTRLHKKLLQSGTLVNRRIHKFHRSKKHTKQIFFSTKKYKSHANIRRKSGKTNCTKSYFKCRYWDPVSSSKPDQPKLKVSHLTNFAQRT